jgi:hypothetical protein
MHEHICIGMAQEPFFMRDPDPTQNENAVCDQPMKIETNACFKSGVRHPSFPLMRRWIIAGFKNNTAHSPGKYGNGRPLWKQQGRLRWTLPHRVPCSVRLSPERLP